MDSIVHFAEQQRFTTDDNVLVAVVEAGIDTYVVDLGIVGGQPEPASAGMEAHQA
jgi:hypothetical protein